MRSHGCATEVKLLWRWQVAGASLASSFSRGTHWTRVERRLSEATRIRAKPSESFQLVRCTKPALQRIDAGVALLP